MANPIAPFVSLCMFTQDSPLIEFELNFLNRIRLALIQCQAETPTLPEGLDKRVTQLADQVYAIDELAYYLDVPDSDVEVEHLREAGFAISEKSSAYVNPWIVQNRFIGKVELFDAKTLAALDYPVTNMMLIGVKE